MVLKFSKENAKLARLRDVPELSKWLDGKRKIYSFDILSGWSCPHAKDCLSKVIIDESGKRKIQDGKHTEFRCFSASQEVVYTNVYKSRKHNFDALKSSDDIANLIRENLPKNLGILRIHVAGDFFSQSYFDAWIEVAKDNPDRLFYAYTKSLPYWVKRLRDIPQNFVLTASRGGRKDAMIAEHNLRESVVVFSEGEAKEKGLEIDHDDSHAAVPEWKFTSFALLIHGVQPKGSEASEAIKQLKKDGVNFAYSKK